MTSPAHGIVDFIDLGEISYSDAYRLQRETHEAVVASRGSSGAPLHESQSAGKVFLLEHRPSVITVSRRPGAAANVLASRGQLERMGVEVVETDRGGDVTWHGRGQIVAYLVLDLNRLGLRVNGYLRMLEGAVIDTLAQVGIEGSRDVSATGVWVGERKICAMGVRLSRWVSMHGLALNVAPDLDQFGLIVPCGLVGRPVTSIQRELGSNSPGVAEMKRILQRNLAQHIESAGMAAIHSRPTETPGS